MDIFVNKWNEFWTMLGSNFIVMSRPLFIAVIIGLLIMYGVSSPSKKEQYKSWLFIVLFVLIGIVSATYLIPWFIDFWKQ
ncbi:MAG: hypothetical protein MR601_04170 [Erysipelotrichaceae bacterium]|nr:hypothetical protein [Erysipelotrichaceae bacterium]